MNPHYSNPAGRLWAFLVYSQTNGADSEPILSVWASYLGIAPGYSAEVFTGVAALLRLPEQIRDRLASGRPEDSAARRSLVAAVAEAGAAIEAAAARLDLPVTELRRHYSPETLWALKAASAVFNEAVPEGAARGTASIGGVRASAEAVTAALAAEPPVDIRTRYLLDQHASAIARAARLVPVAGLEVLRDEYHRLVGALAVRPDALRDLQRSEGVTKRVAALIRSLEPFDAGHTPSSAFPTGLLGLHAEESPTS